MRDELSIFVMDVITRVSSLVAYRWCYWTHAYVCNVYVPSSAKWRLWREKFWRMGKIWEFGGEYFGELRHK